MFRILTDMQEIDEFWKAGLLYYRLCSAQQDLWEEDVYHENNYLPSEYSLEAFEYAIQVED